MGKVFIILLFGAIFLGIGVSFLFLPEKVQKFYDRYSKAGRKISNFEVRVVGALALCGFFMILYLLIRGSW